MKLNALFVINNMYILFSYYIYHIIKKNIYYIIEKYLVVFFSNL